MTGKRGKPDVRELAELALLCALMVGTKEAMAALPNVHLVTLLIVLGAQLYGARVLYPVVGFTVIEIGIYGLGLWTVMYLYVWPLIALLAILFRKTDSRLFWSVFAGICGLCFGAACAVPYLFLGGWRVAVSWWVAGIPYDILHGVSNAVLTFVLLPPLQRLAEKRRKT